MRRVAASEVFGFPSVSTMFLVIKMGDLHRVKGYFTQEAHSVLVQQVFSFLQPWKSSTHRESWQIRASALSSRVPISLALQNCWPKKDTWEGTCPFFPFKESNTRSRLPCTLRCTQKRKVSHSGFLTLVYRSKALTHKTCQGRLRYSFL